DDDPSFSSEPGPEPERAAGVEPASAWQADPARQRGYGDDRDRQVSWGAAPDPRTAAPADPTGGALPGVRHTADRTEPEAEPQRQPGARAAGDGTMTIRARSQAAQGTRAPHLPAQSGPGQHGPAASGPAQATASPSVPSQGGPAPVTTGPGGGATSWAQQVHHLAQQPEAPAIQGAPAAAMAPAAAAPGRAGEAAGQPVAPWKPPVDDPFVRAARERAAAKPAGPGRRLAARLVDTVVFGALAGAACAPFVLSGVRHVTDKLDRAKQSGETVTVWLVDGTNAVHFSIALALVLVLGVLYEALPTARWGRTLGKKLCGIQVRDIESHDAPGFGAALRRWLVYGVSGLLAVGVLNVLWCLVDRPWRQCWHDKAARTFVAKG
ncbi:RDD family protein, partial [Streptomyces sp. CC77]|uniref:RDD family protein n=1 Tax=Streptomyces sp. CC77 TaxID=1906739 RepID=UPI0008DE7AF0